MAMATIICVLILEHIVSRAYERRLTKQLTNRGQAQGMHLPVMPLRALCKALVTRVNSRGGSHSSQRLMVAPRSHLRGRCTTCELWLHVWQD